MTARVRGTVPLLVTLGLLASHPSAFASDGVLEINQAKALAGGVTPGDAPGFPVTLSQPGSFRLTGNLDLRVLGLPASVDTIAIDAPFIAASVTIDLNGFSILGPNVCNGTSCTYTGAGSGISGSSVTVRNGYITGVGGYGILCSDNCRVEDVIVSHSGGVGIYGNKGSVSRALVTLSGYQGIDIGAGLVTDSSSLDNGGVGIRAVHIERSYALSNGGAGFSVETGSVAQSVSTDNALGLLCLGKCALSANLFAGCTGGACFSGAGTRLQVPPSSNMCGTAACP